MGFGRRALSALGKIGTALSVVVLFFLGLLGTIYLSLRTSEVKVPDLLGKDRFAAEAALTDAGLNIRIKGTRPSEKKPDTVLSQLPESGMVVKAGQTVAVEVSRQPKEGEAVASSEGETAKPEGEKPQENANANANSTQPSNQNQNQNQNKPKNTNTNKNKNSNNSNNKNANNSNNRNANNANNSNANRNNANRGNVNTNRTANNGNRGANTNNSAPNANRGTTNANRRLPIQTPPFNPGANRGTP